MTLTTKEFRNLDIRFLSYTLPYTSPKTLLSSFISVPWAWNALPPAFHLSLFVYASDSHFLSQAFLVILHTEHLHQWCIVLFSHSFIGWIFQCCIFEYQMVCVCVSVQVHCSQEKTHRFHHIFRRVHGSKNVKNHGCKTSLF